MLHGGGEARRWNDWWQIWHSVCSRAQVTYIGGGGGRPSFGDLRFESSRFDTERHIDWCCFYYCVRNILVALLEALCARICSLDPWISFFSDIFFLVCARSHWERRNQPHAQTHTHKHNCRALIVFRVCCSIIQFLAVCSGGLQCVAGKNQAATNTWIRVMTWVMCKISAHVKPQTGLKKGTRPALFGINPWNVKVKTDKTPVWRILVNKTLKSEMFR